jgi:hypothetical protein
MKKKQRLIRVTAWVEIMGKRAETTFTVVSPLVCEGACPRIQEAHDEQVAGWIFQSQCKNGFTVEPVSDENTPAD